MEQEVIQNTIVNTLAINVLLAFVALTCLWLILRWFDWLSGERFRNVSDKIRQDPLASALYYGARFFGCAFLLAYIFSAVRF